MMAGRLLAARLLGRVKKSHVVLASAVGAAAGSALLLAASSLALVAAGVAIIGLSYASVYPTSLAMVGDRYRERTGAVFGALFSIALIGGMLFPWGIGRIGQAAGVRYGMVLPLAGALMIALLMSDHRSSRSGTASREPLWRVGERALPAC